MKKLTLDLDTLRVETFETAGTGGDGRGTVQGNGVSDTTCNERLCGCPTNGLDCGSRVTDCGCVSFTCLTACNQGSCQETCMYSCGPTCGYSCEGTCGCPTWWGETCGIC